MQPVRSLIPRMATNCQWEYCATARIFSFSFFSEDKTPCFTLGVFDNGAKSSPVTRLSGWNDNVQAALLEIRVACEALFFLPCSQHTRTESTQGISQTRETLPHTGRMPFSLLDKCSKTPEKPWFSVKKGNLKNHRSPQ